MRKLKRARSAEQWAKLDDSGSGHVDFDFGRKSKDVGLEAVKALIV